MQIANNNLAPIQALPFEASSELPENKHVPSPIEEKKTEESKKTDSVFDFVDKKIMPVTSFGSAALNMISAPIRLYDDANPVKKMINKVSMFATKLHLALYGLVGMKSAHKNKNPLLIFSFATECLSAFFDLRKIYLFRGIATGVDGAVGAFKDRFEKLNPGKIFKHKNYGDGFKENLKHFKEIINEIKERPAILTELKGEHTLVSSSIMMILGSIIGLTVSDKVGASIRDFFGGLNDFGLTQINNPTARKSGAFYLLGTAKDLMARAFTESTAKLFGVTEVEKFKRGRDFMHELALAFDRVGQFFFLRFVNSDKSQEQEKTVNKKDPIKNLHEEEENLYSTAA